MGLFSLWATPESPQISNLVATSASSSDACPVDPKARSIWLQSQQQQADKRAPQTASEDACPVDHKTRSVWLQQQQTSQDIKISLPPSTTPSTYSIPSEAKACSSSTISHQPLPSPPLSAPNLSQEREVSTIPRALPQHTSPTSHTNLSANSETSSPLTSSSGNWIYPSEAQFFQAVLRKNHNTPNTSPESLAESVSSIIPIHNAVNERSWQQIREWERKHSTAVPSIPANPATNANPRTCPPKLLSFRGSGSGPDHDLSTPSGIILSYLSLLDPRTPLTPRARWNALLGYQTPFDRHDWVVERCDGASIEYVIDFYQGKSSPATNNHTTQQLGIKGKAEAITPTTPKTNTLNFYLDVRPKLNSLEGWKMRWRKAVGEWI